MSDFLGASDWTTTEVIGEGEGGERGLDGRRDRVARKTTAGDETRRPKRADASWDAPAAGSEAAARLRRRVRRVAIGKVDDVYKMNVVRAVVGGVVVVAAVDEERRERRDGPVRKACESDMAACMVFELDMWLCII